MEKHLDITISASYSTLNELTEDTERIWLAFHGYGMLSQYFIKKFEVLDPKRNFIVAPQGLSKYYLEGFYGRVGASWMTKEDRLTEIDNQQRYIKAVLAKEGVNPDNAEIIMFGFSQGTATATRFGAFSGLPFSKLILWSGTFPEDLPPEQVQHWPEELPIHFLVGTEDPFYKKGMEEEQKALVKRITGKTLQFTSFEGKHEVIPELLLQI